MSDFFEKKKKGFCDQPLSVNGSNVDLKRLFDIDLRFCDYLG